MSDRKQLLARHILTNSMQPKQRLQYPVASQQRKHFEKGTKDQVRLGTERCEESVFWGKIDKMDTADIEGAQPKLHYLSKGQQKTYALRT